MRAAVCPEYGPPEVVHIEERPAPETPPGGVRVRVHAAAVNFPDVLLIANKYQISVPPPFVPGSEFAGVVDEITEGVSDLAIGDRVTGAVLYGAFAEHVFAEPDGLRRIPDGVDMHTAAAFGVAYRTAYHTLRSVARVQAGDELVVLGAGGGVGLAAVQLGEQLGASVTAVASSDEKLYCCRILRSKDTSSTTDQVTCALRSGRRFQAEPTPSSTRSAATCPNPRCERCAAAAASSPSATRRG